MKSFLRIPCLWQQSILMKHKYVCLSLSFSVCSVNLYRRKNYKVFRGVNWYIGVITSLAKEVMFLVALVCLFVCGQHYSKSCEWIGMKF